MLQRKDYRTGQSLNDIQRYEKWGNLLAKQCVVQFSSTNVSARAFVIYDGLEYFKAKMKLSVLQDNQHTDEEKEKRLKQIDIETHQMDNKKI